MCCLIGNISCVQDILLEYLTKDSWVVADKEISVKSISEEMGKIP
jgi:hypothetical protein